MKDLFIKNHSDRKPHKERKECLEILFTRLQAIQA